MHDNEKPNIHNQEQQKKLDQQYGREHWKQKRNKDKTHTAYTNTIIWNSNTKVINNKLEIKIKQGYYTLHCQSGRGERERGTHKLTVIRQSVVWWMR